MTALALAGMLLLLGISSAASAHHLLPRHELLCSGAFPCPDALRTRIDFWIQTFSSWDGGQAVLHDSKDPGRVFDLFRARSCGDEIDDRREALEKELLRLAGKVERGQPVRSRREKHLLNVFVFPRHRAEDIRASAGRLRCQQGVRDQFVAGLERYYRYRGMVARILKEYGLPAELQYLPFVESSYNPSAYSRAEAAGLWQIMPATARTLGLQLDAAIDERLDPESATIAAARYLKDARARLMDTAREIDPDVTAAGINPFVVTSYNYGINGMRRAVRQEGPDFVRVIRNYKSPAFQVAVQNFYASFLAARHVARNAKNYFGKVKKEPPLAYQTVVLQQPASVGRIREVFGVDEATLKALNPALTRFVWNDWRQMPDGYRLRLPPLKDGWKRQIAELRALPPEPEQLYQPTYTVRKGDTACSIAQAFRIDCEGLIAANQLEEGKIEAGRKLQIPGHIVAEEEGGREATGEEPRKKPTALRYQVRKGDTLCEVAERFDLPCKSLREANGIGPRGTIRIGRKLTIPAGKGSSPPVSATCTVGRGDTACGIAERYAVPCRELISRSDLGSKGVIRVGQTLRIPAGFGSRGGTPAAAGSGLAAPLDRLPDLAVQKKKGAYFVRAAAEESLGHYADWLGLGGIAELRRVNGLETGTPLAIGTEILLPVKRRETVARFERRREEYHQVLAEQFRERYAIRRLDDYTVRPGDSAWSIANGNDLPLWLLLRFNPELAERPVTAGQKVKVPVVAQRGAAR